MTLTLDGTLEAAIAAEARERGIDPTEVVLEALHYRFSAPPFVPRDDWERRLLAIGRPAGVSLPNEALTSEAIYE